MADIIIRGVEDDLFRKLETLARTNDQTVEEFVHEVLWNTATLTAEERIARIKRIRAMQTDPLPMAAWQLIREDRDNR